MAGLENDTVSIVICFKNRPVAHALNALKSFEWQTVKPHEVIFVDCGSKPAIRDRLEEVCKQYGAKHLYLPQPTGSPHKTIFGGIPNNIPVKPLYILHETGKARNYGIKRATGKYVTISQTDLVFNPIVVESIIFSHKYYKRGSLIMARIRLLGKKANLDSVKLPENFDALWRGAKIRGGRAVQSVERSWWLKVHGYDERMRYNADLDLERRARMDGLGVAFINGYKNYLRALRREAKILHLWHGKSVIAYKRKNPLFRLLMQRRKIERTETTIIRNPNGWGEEPIW